MMEKEKKIQMTVMEEDILYQSGIKFFNVFDTYRIEKKINTRQLIQGVISDRAFLDIKKGKHILAKSDWEFLMQRMGIVTDYFETIVSRRELDDWRLREDICLCVFERPNEATKMLEQYQKNFQQGKNGIQKIQEQFYLKMKWILFRKVLKAEQFYKLASDAVSCTVSDEKWQEKLESLYVGPAELEAMLLVVWSLFLLGNNDKALTLFWKIKLYPEEHGWEPRMQQMIVPQIVLIGMRLLEEFHMDEEAYQLGETGVELLRDQCSQRYAYPVLKELCRIGKQLKKEGERQQQIQNFTDIFEIIYKANQVPCMRIWQCNSIKNSYDISLVLKRMRCSLEKTQLEICTDENGFPFLSVKQLSRIEKGQNRPSGEVFRYLTRKMERKIDWIMPMLETDSVQALSIRQDIMYLDGMKQLNKEKELIEKLKTIMGEENCKKPYICQELMFIETSLEYEAGNITAKEAQKLYYEALSYTFPIEYLSRKTLPFIRREEGMLISNIAYLHHKIGETAKAQELFEKLYEVFRPQQQLFKINNPACAVMLGQYSSLLGDVDEYQKALDIDIINFQCEINDSYLVLINGLLYNQAWDHYELDKNKYQRRYRQEFSSAQIMTNFIKDSKSASLYQKRRKKYLE